MCNAAQGTGADEGRAVCHTQHSQQVTAASLGEHHKSQMQLAQAGFSVVVLLSSGVNPPCHCTAAAPSLVLAVPKRQIPPKMLNKDKSTGKTACK